MTSGSQIKVNSCHPFDSKNTSPQVCLPHSLLLSFPGPLFICSHKSLPSMHLDSIFHLLVLLLLLSYWLTSIPVIFHLARSGWSLRLVKIFLAHDTDIPPPSFTSLVLPANETHIYFLSPFRALVQSLWKQKAKSTEHDTVSFISFLKKCFPDHCEPLNPSHGVAFNLSLSFSWRH